MATRPRSSTHINSQYGYSPHQSAHSSYASQGTGQNHKPQLLVSSTHGTYSLRSSLKVKGMTSALWCRNTYGSSGAHQPVYVPRIQDFQVRGLAFGPLARLGKDIHKKGHDYNIALLVFFIPYILFKIATPSGVGNRAGAG